jgi:threonine/homoserine/homoserine lactone efflux protein
MERYFLFLIVAAAAVVTPGPGVTLTITNSLRYGVAGAFQGIFGLVAGALLIATLSATGVGFIITTSPMAFNAMKYAGAAYLVYLGVRLWRSPALHLEERDGKASSGRKRFIESLTLQLSNPKALAFFLSVFPQFIDPKSSMVIQFSVLALTYCSLIVALHTTYAFAANSARQWFSSSSGRLVINRVGGVAFVCFAVAMIAASQ